MHLNLLPIKTLKDNELMEIVGSVESMLIKKRKFDISTYIKVVEIKSTHPTLTTASAANWCIDPSLEPRTK